MKWNKVLCLIFCCSSCQINHFAHAWPAWLVRLFSDRSRSSTSIARLAEALALVTDDKSLENEEAVEAAVTSDSATKQLPQLEHAYERIRVLVASHLPEMYDPENDSEVDAATADVSKELATGSWSSSRDRELSPLEKVSEAMRQTQNELEKLFRSWIRHPSVRVLFQDAHTGRMQGMSEKFKILCEKLPKELSSPPVAKTRMVGEPLSLLPGANGAAPAAIEIDAHSDSRLEIEQGAGAATSSATPSFTGNSNPAAPASAPPTSSADSTILGFPPNLVLPRDGLYRQDVYSVAANFRMQIWDLARDYPGKTLGRFTKLLHILLAALPNVHAYYFLRPDNTLALFSDALQDVQDVDSRLNPYSGKPTKDTGADVEQLEQALEDGTSSLAAVERQIAGREANDAAAMADVGAAYFAGVGVYLRSIDESLQEKYDRGYNFATSLLAAVQKAKAGVAETGTQEKKKMQERAEEVEEEAGGGEETGGTHQGQEGKAGQRQEDAGGGGPKYAAIESVFTLQGRVAEVESLPDKLFFISSAADVGKRNRFGKSGAAWRRLLTWSAVCTFCIAGVICLRQRQITREELRKEKLAALVTKQQEQLQRKAEEEGVGQQPEGTEVGAGGGEGRAGVKDEGADGRYGALGSTSSA